MSSLVKGWRRRGPIATRGCFPQHQMRRSIILLAVFFALIAGSACFASKAGELINKAERAAAKATQRGVSSADRDENYEKAIEAFDTVKDKYPNTLERVEAMYGIARIHETAKGEFRDSRKAYAGYKELVSGYKPGGKFDERWLNDNFERREIAKVKEIANLAEEGKSRVAEELDKQNRGDWKYKILDFFVALTNRIPWFSYWFAIILVTFIVKIAMTPLTKAQFKAMKEMQKVAPLVKEIQAKYKGEQKTIGEKTMALYKEHHINPFASCLPILFQMPVLFLLFYMIRSYEFQFAKGTFLWIGSALQHLHSFSIMGNRVYLTAANLAEPDVILVLLYVVSMYISTKMSAVDPTQAEQQKMMAIVMPVMFAFIFVGFPSAFLLYWLVFNVIQTVQQYLILHGGPQEAATPPTPEPPPAEPEKPSDQRPPRRKRRRK